METTSGFSTRFKELRVAKGLTQAALASGLKLNTHTIKDYESGRRQPGPKGLAKIASFFGVSPSSLLSEEVLGDAPAILSPSDLFKRALAIPDDIYELAYKAGRDSDAWEVVRGALEGAIELKQSKTSKRQG